MGALTFPHPPLAAGRLAAKLLNRHSPHEIAEAITVLIDVLDLLGGDPEAEDATDAEDDFAHSDRAEALWPRHDTDTEAGAYAEWNTMPAISRKGGTCLVESCGHEDDEDDDPLDSTGAEDDGLPRFKLMGSGPGCVVSDPDYDTGDI